MQVADVAVRVVLADGQQPIFSYVVPPALRERLQIGSSVWVPVGRREVQGLILRLSDHADAARLRPITAAGDDDWLVSSQSLELAQWIARRYQAAPASAFELLFPAGSRQESQATLRVSTAGLGAELAALPADERALLYYLRHNGEQTVKQLRTQLRGGDARLRTAERALLERGLIERGTEVAAARIRQQRERTVERAQGPDHARTAPRQQALLEWLQHHPGSQPVRLLREAGVWNAGAARALTERGLLITGELLVERRTKHDEASEPDHAPTLTAAQLAAVDAIGAALAAPPPERVTGGRFLLFGITGSGKTEVYMQATADAIRRGRQVLVLVPEIALTEQIVRRFQARFGDSVAVLHSGRSDGARYDEWRRLARGTARIAIGSRSAVCASLPELGLVIVDEEHEPAYKHDATPRFHARDAAAYLARISGAVLVMGSATPSVESMYAVETGRLTLLKLAARATAAALPNVRIVDMRNELQRGNRSIFSQLLQMLIDAALQQHEQVLLFLNRRGEAISMLCRDCGYVVSCPRCNVPMAVHGEHGAAAQRLLCHSCGRLQALPAACPTCLSPRIKALGIGTQRVVAAAQERWPQARIVRWDSDSARRGADHRRLLDQLERHEADIVVGTQMIAKGLDVAGIAVVGVIAADTGLHLPDYRSGERTFQLLTQVAGRAGRQRSGAQVVLQSYTPEHYALRAAQEHDYDTFYREEIAFRRAVVYPPFSRLIRFVQQSVDRARGERIAAELAERLQSWLSQQSEPEWSLIGPAPAFFERTRGRWRQHLLIRMPADIRHERVTALMQAAAPLRDWSIDIDPIHVL